ncbi:hypothetical protein BJ165DRAFT_1410621 [Panaeolus papilionaceus]|nr:hypothetical protein BJ165DRAFT_1410621 [Panaeolus papilionaceus]
MFAASRSAMTNTLFTIIAFLTILFAITPTLALPVAQLEIAQHAVARRSNPAGQPSSLLGRVYHVESRNDNPSAALVAKEENEEQWAHRANSDDEPVLEFRPLARAQKFHRRMSMKARMDAA